METILLGRSREKIPLIGMGTWKLGKDPKKEIEALKAGISAGMRFIDTAEMYGTEGLVGEAAKGEEVFIATKVSPNHFREKDVIKACGRSLYLLFRILPKLPSAHAYQRYLLSAPSE